MRQQNDDVGSKEEREMGLKPGVLSAVKLKVILNPSAIGYDRTVEIECHSWNWVGETSTSIDVWRVEGGRLCRIAGYNEVLTVEERPVSAR